MKTTIFTIACDHDGNDCFEIDAETPEDDMDLVGFNDPSAARARAACQALIDAYDVDPGTAWKKWTASAEDPLS